jgi:GTP-sensing pleiotropic transcriptional regulator CodY
LDKWYLTDVSQGIFSTTLLIECTESLFADIPTSDRMIVCCFSVPLIGIMMLRFIAATANSEHSSARNVFPVRQAICRYETEKMPAIRSIIEEIEKEELRRMIKRE